VVSGLGGDIGLGLGVDRGVYYLNNKYQDK